MADFQQFYGINLEDLWTGGLSPRRALILSGHLLDIPDSRYAAIDRGGRQFLGWGTDRYLAAENHDLLVLLANMWGAKFGQEQVWPRPKATVKEKPVGTIAEFRKNEFMGWLMGK